MIPYIMVEPKQWSEMIQAMEENASLKDEVLALRIELAEAQENYHLVNEMARKEMTRLKAEVERLRASSFVTAVPVEQYERVVKAGDAMQKSMLEVGPNEMAEEFDHDRWWASYNAWTAAKEGKPSV